MAAAPIRGGNGAGPGADGRAAPIELLVVQGTPFCNIDCSYCYLPARSDRRRMSEEVAERLFARVFESPFVADRFTVIWHAGEPLVPGVAYYERMLALIERLRPAHVRVEHSFQTNGTLIDDAWVTFFRRTGAGVGVSLDGPQRLHDRHRKTRSGKGTFEATMRGVRRLQDGNIPFHVIAVLTREALDCPDELHAFFLDAGIDKVGFNIEEIEGEHARSSLSAAGAEAATRRFFARMIALNRAAPRPLEIRELSGAFAAILRADAADRGNPQVEPMRILSCDVDGNLSTFSPELLGYSDARYGAFVFGNVRSHALADMLDEPRFCAVAADIRAGVARCAEACAYFGLCGGGAPANKLFENGAFDTAETLYCRLTRQAVVDVALAELESGLAESGEVSKCECAA